MDSSARLLPRAFVRKPTDYAAAARDFYRLLVTEVVEGNPQLDPSEQAALRAHYPVMMQPEVYPRGLTEQIYAARRKYPIQAVCESTHPVVFDAGCGFGSESCLFAWLGARVIAADADPAKIEIARRRQCYFEEKLHRNLAIRFEVGDLDELMPEGGLTLTWLASVLAAIRDQDAFLTRVASRTNPGGQVIVSDMNLTNPLFLAGEWRRREQAKRLNPEFAARADFRAMVSRRGRIGARYFSAAAATPFDDVQFFSAGTLRRLLSRCGFAPRATEYSGFVPPRLYRSAGAGLEQFLPNLPLARQLGYFYTVCGVKAE